MTLTLTFRHGIRQCSPSTSTFPLFPLIRSFFLFYRICCTPYSCYAKQIYTGAGVVYIRVDAYTGTHTCTTHTHTVAVCYRSWFLCAAKPRQKFIGSDTHMNQYVLAYGLYFESPQPSSQTKKKHTKFDTLETLITAYYVLYRLFWRIFRRAARSSETGSGHNLFQVYLFTN